MDETLKKEYVNLINHITTNNAAEFNNTFDKLIKHKVSERINDERKVVAASFFSPPTEN